MNKAQDLLEYLDAGGDFPPTLDHYAVELKKQHDLMLDALKHARDWFSAAGFDVPAALHVRSAIEAVEGK